LLKKPAFTVLLMANCVGYFALFGVIFNIPSRAASLGVDPSLVPYVLPILNAVSLAGRRVHYLVSLASLTLILPMPPDSFRVSLRIASGRSTLGGLRTCSPPSSFLLRELLFLIWKPIKLRLTSLFNRWIPAKNELGVLWTAATYGFSSGAWVRSSTYEASWSNSHFPLLQVSVLPACIPRIAGPENVA
jgi:hypothetical protein